MAVSTLTEVLRMEIDFPRKGVRIRMGRAYATRAPQNPKRSFMERVTNSELGSVEIAFDHENGYIIVEVIAAEIRCAVIDIDHEVLGGQ